MASALITSTPGILSVLALIGYAVGNYAAFGAAELLHLVA